MKVRNCVHLLGFEGDNIEWKYVKNKKGQQKFEYYYFDFCPYCGKKLTSKDKGIDPNIEMGGVGYR